MVKLGVNIDHVATLRQLRGTKYPDPVAAALLAEQAGADQITIHLRADRRHIQDQDLSLLRRSVQTELNLEMALTDEMLRIASDVRPNSVTLVPEKRKELTTEGGLDVLRLGKRLREAIPDLKGKGIRVSLFVDPERSLVEAAREVGADAIEIHTGRYAEVRFDQAVQKELSQVAEMSRFAKSIDLWVAAGHGLNYQNVVVVAAIPEIVELNIGHAIVARSLFVGFAEAVREMKRLLS